MKTSKNNTPENGSHSASRREGAPQDIVPFRKTNRQRTNVSIALQNIEQFRSGTIGNEVILCGGTLKFMEINGNKFPLLLPSQMIEISKGLQQLNMIFRACSNGVLVSRKAIDIGRELLRGSKDLEECLKILASLQYASNYLSSSSQNQIRLLKGNEDVPSSGQANKTKLIKPTFSFDKKSDRTNYKEKEIMDNVSILKCNLSRPSSNSHLQFNYHRRSLSVEFDVKPIERNDDFRRGINHSGNIGQNDDLRGGLRNEKLRIPSVVAKLMGLEELPLAMSEVKKKEVQYVHNTNQLQASGNINTHEKTSASERKGENIVKGKSSVHIGYATDSENNKQIEPTNSKHRSSLYSESLKSTMRKQIDVDDKDFMVLKNEVVKSRRKMLPKQPAHGEPMHQREFKIQAIEHSTENVKLLNEQHPKIAEHKKEGRRKTVASVSKGSAKEVNKAIKQKQSPIQKSKINQDMDNATTKTKRTLSKKGSMFNTANDTIQKISSSILIKRVNKTTTNFSEKTQLKQYPNEKCNGKNKSHGYLQAQHEVEDISKNKGLIVPVNKDEVVIPQICKLEPVPTAEKVEHKTYVNVINKNTVNIVEEIRTAISEVNLYDMKSTASFLHELEQKLKERSFKSEKTKISYPTMKFEEHSQQNAAVGLSSISDEAYENCLTEQMEDQQEIGRNSVLGQPKFVMDLAYPHLAEMHGGEGQELPLLPENAKSEEMQHIYKSEVLDQKLTEEEFALRNVLVIDSQFLNAAEALLKVKIPIGILHETENICVNENNKLIFDTGYEVMRNKCKRDEALFTNKTPSPLTQVRCFDNLIRKLNDDFKSLEPQCMTEDNIPERLQYMIEKDIENRNPDINCMWDTCWSNVVIPYVTKEQIIKDLEKHMLNGLINELVKDLTAAHCIS